MLPFYSKAQKKNTQKFIIKLGLESRSIVSWDGIVSIVPYNLYAEKLDKNIIAAYHKRQSFIQGIWSYRNKGIPAENRLKSHHKKVLWRNNITFITRKLGFMFSFCHSGTHYLLANPKDIIKSIFSYSSTIQLENSILIFPPNWLLDVSMCHSLG